MQEGAIVNGYFFLAGVILVLCGEPLLAFGTWAVGGIVAL